MPSRIDIVTGDGKARAWYFAPQLTSHSGVVVFMDVFGIRPAFFQVAERLSSMGHNVLLPDLYYRLGDYDPFSVPEALASPSLLAQAREMRDRTPPLLTATDTPFFVDALTHLGATGKIATLGYCMGGGRAMRAADAVPERVAAAASIHGGNLAIDNEASPHHYLNRMKARVYIGCAGIDPSFPPGQSALLIEAMRNSGIDHQIENYVNCEHGWAIPDNPIYNEQGAERHWKRLRTLFDETLR